MAASASDVPRHHPKTRRSFRLRALSAKFHRASSLNRETVSLISKDRTENKIMTMTLTCPSSKTEPLEVVYRRKRNDAGVVRSRLRPRQPLLPLKRNR